MDSKVAFPHLIFRVLQIQFMEEKNKIKTYSPSTASPILLQSYHQSPRRCSLCGWPGQQQQVAQPYLSLELPPELGHCNSTRGFAVAAGPSFSLSHRKKLQIKKLRTTSLQATSGIKSVHSVRFSTCITAARLLVESKQKVQALFLFFLFLLLLSHL